MKHIMIFIDGTFHDRSDIICMHLKNGQSVRRPIEAESLQTAQQQQTK